MGLNQVKLACIKFKYFKGTIYRLKFKALRKAFNIIQFIIRYKIKKIPLHYEEIFLNMKSLFSLISSVIDLS